VRRRLHFGWECLGRVDSIDGELASLMKRAGCERIFFGIESGSEEVLRLMNKRITTEKARLAVEAAHAAGLKTGAFFILFYPGETDETVLATLQFAGSLPLDYLSFTMPYPIPGTRLFERVKNRAIRDWRQSFGLLFDHTLVFDADFSQAKMRFAILKGQVEFEIKRRLGGIAPAALKLLQKPTTILLRAMR
jgi:anaerobic magnesium-protoporphyrin IX monomethyl ester cyclase